MWSEKKDKKEAGVDKGRLILSANARGPFGSLLVDLITLPILPHIVAVVCFGCLLLVTSWLWVEMRERFPRLAPGSYVGEIFGVFPGEPDRATRFFVESTSSNELLIALTRLDWTPQLITVVGNNDDPEKSDWLHPVVISASGSKLKFTGSQDGYENYAGFVKDMVSGARGRWTLQPLVERNPTLPGTPGRVEMQLWLRLKAELAEVDAQIAAAEAKVPVQRKELDKLTEFITEGDNLRARADEKYRNVKAELEILKETLKVKQDEAKELEKKILLSNSVTPVGKLVSLARASLEREARWIESLLRTGTIEPDEELEMAVERGKGVLDLKRQIEQERERIYTLRAAQPGAGNIGTPPASFDGIWSQP